MSIDRSLKTDPDMPMPDAANIPNPIPLKFGTHYTLQLAGVKLARHQHTEADQHWCVVLDGRMTLREWKTVNGVETLKESTIRKGDLVDLGTDPHEFEALVDGCVFVNITKTSQPARRRQSIEVEVQAADEALKALFDRHGLVRSGEAT